MTLDGGGYNLTGQQMTFNFMYPSQYTTLQTHYHGLNQRAYDQSGKIYPEVELDKMK